MYSKLFYEFVIHNDECGPSIAGLKNGLDPSWAAPGKYMCMCVWVVWVCVCVCVWGVCVLPGWDLERNPSTVISG